MMSTSEHAKSSGLLDRVARHQSAFAAARALYAESLAPDFSLFRFIDADELQLSNIIAWLLEPSGSHGQGSRFLVLFVEKFNLAWDEAVCASASVKKEAPCPSARIQSQPSASQLDFARRIDILVHSGSHGIAIENKLNYAADQDNQVQDYFIHLDQKFKGSRCLIYLSPDRSPPTLRSISASESDIRKEANELVIMGGGDLAPWVEACKASCRAHRVSFFLDEFYRYIQQRFSGIKDMSQRDLIVSEMTSSRDSVAASLEVYKAAEQMKNALMAKLETQLQNEAKKRGWDNWVIGPKSVGEQTRGVGARGTGILIKFCASDQFAFAVGFGNDQRTFFAYGIHAKEPNLPESARIHEAMEKAFHNGKIWPHWPWGKQTNIDDDCLPIEGDWNAGDKPWLAIADGSLAAVIVNAAEKVREVLLKNRLIVDQPQQTATQT